MVSIVFCLLNVPQRPVCWRLGPQPIAPTGLALCPCSLPPPPLKTMDYIPKASQSPRSLPLFGHWLNPEKKHQGPTIKIHSLANLSDQDLPTHPSTDSLLSLTNLSLQKHPPWLSCLLAATAAFADTPPPTCPFGVTNHLCAENSVSGYVLCQLGEHPPL